MDGRRERQEAERMKLSPFFPALHGVELRHVVHDGGLQGHLLHEHGRGGDVLDLGLQEHLICLGPVCGGGGAGGGAFTSTGFVL